MTEFLLRSFLDPCAAVRCSFYGQCFANVDDSHSCDCPDLNSCARDQDPVCGTNGRTYINACFMKVFSCRNNVEVNVKHQGACGKNNVFYF
jgi:coxsackievirus/adenovirus receptor